jgi:hypothetical protein
VTIPRGVVAAALNVPEDTLPPGDLPLDRFAARYLDGLASPDDEDPPEAWTQALILELVRSHPHLALDALRAALDAAKDADSIAMIAAGPLEDLLTDHGPDMIAAIEEAAAASPRLRYALTGVSGAGIKPLVLARLDAIRAGGPSLDTDAPPPP